MSLIPFGLWLLVLCPYYMFVICSGAFLYHTKLLAHRDIWNTWVYLFTGRVNRYGKKGVFDTKLLNDAFFLQLLLTSLPILLVKITNYLQNDARGLYTSDAFKVFYPDFIMNKDVFIAWVHTHSLTHSNIINQSLTYSLTYSHPFRWHSLLCIVLLASIAMCICRYDMISCYKKCHSSV